MVQAHAAGLSVRKIATAAGLSPTRVHQVVSAATACAAPPRPTTGANQARDALQKIALFSSLDDAALAALSKHAVLRRFPKRTILFHEGDESDTLYVILDGRLQVYIHGSAGKEVLLRTLAPGDYFGELSLLDQQPRSASVRTLEPCRIVALSRAAFTACLSQFPHVALELLRALTKTVRHSNDRLQGLATSGVYERLVNTLQELSEERDGVTVIQGMTHQALAERVYASREMVTLLLKDLKQSGYIHVGRGHITIKKRLPSQW